MAETSKQVNGDDAQDLHSLLSSPARDFLVRNDGEQVKVDSLIGKKIGLYFSAAWCGPCQRFTPQLVEVYNELSSKVGFEIVFVSGDEDEESFGDYFSKMPWLAVPFTDSETRDRLDELFKVRGIPNLVMVDDHGKLVNENGVGVIRSYGADAYPFTPEKMKEIKEDEDRARREQTLTSVLVTPSRDFVISPEGNKVPVSELEGKTIGLLFSVASYRKCTEFTPKLVEFYTKLKENKEDFEIVLISLEDDEESFNMDFKTKPWLALPFNDKSGSKLARHFMLSTLPTLVILGPDGKTRHSNVAEAIDDYGVLAYPFTPEKFQELKEIENAKVEAQTLESLLVSGDLNYVLGKDGAKVLVSAISQSWIMGNVISGGSRPENHRDRTSPPYPNPSAQYQGNYPSPYQDCARYPYGEMASPVQYVEHQEAVTIRNDINLKKETLRLEPDEQNPGKFLLSFTFDASVPGSITVMFFAKEGKDCNLIATKEDLFPSTQVSFAKGLEQRFKQACGTGIDFSDMSEADLVEANETDVYHVAVKAEVVSEDDHPESGTPNRQITHVVLEKDHKGEYKARVVKQILWVNGNRYVLQEIYGIGNTVDDNGEDANERGKECVICLSEPRDTTVLPCRHMCMCSGCAKLLRFQTNLCPICRQPVDRLLEITVNNNDRN